MKKILLLLVLWFYAITVSLAQGRQERIRLVLHEGSYTMSAPEEGSGALVIFGDPSYVDRLPDNSPNPVTTMSFHNAIDYGDGIGSMTTQLGLMRYHVPSGTMVPLSQEKRAYVGDELPSNNDTLPLVTAMLGRNGVTTYTLCLMIDTLQSAVAAKIEDTYLGTSTTIITVGSPGRTGRQFVNYPFSLDATPASRASTRFRIVLSNNAAYSRPIFHFATTQAVETAPHRVLITWKPQNEASIASYEIQAYERKKFVSKQMVQKGDKYASADPRLVEGGATSFRVKANLLNGTAAYSDTFTITRQLLHAIQRFTIYPNPAAHGRMATLQFAEGIESGRSVVEVIRSIDGYVVRRETVPIPGDRQLSLRGIPSGTYVIRITPTDRSIESYSQQLIVQ